MGFVITIPRSKILVDWGNNATFAHIEIVNTEEHDNTFNESVFPVLLFIISCAL